MDCAPVYLFTGTGPGQPAPGSGVYVLRLLWTIRPLSALKEASRPQWYHRWDDTGTLGPCVRPSVRRRIGPVGLNLQEKEGY